MKLTREMLHRFIDSQPKECSAEQIVVDLMASCMIKVPQILPDLTEAFGNVLSEITNRHLQAFNMCSERAWHLETYLDGRMYKEEYNDKPEYKELQKGHAVAIQERCREMLNIK